MNASDKRSPDRRAIENAETVDSALMRARAETVVSGVHQPLTPKEPISDKRGDPPPSAAAAPVQPGTVIKHYEIIREIGKGGMGTVFLARDIRLGRLVAIKFLLQHKGLVAARFLAEARTTAQCRHDNIVVIYDVDELYGYPYMVLEYIQGQPLRAVMTQSDRLAVDEKPGVAITASALFPPALAIALMLPVVRALVCAHERGIVHRDLKPENILLADNGQIKVLDFGIAKQITTEMAPTYRASEIPFAANVALTQAGAILGTLPYMSPEQLSAQEADTASDIWAVGIMLYELLTGSHPLEPFSRTRIAEVVNLDIPMPSACAKRPDAVALAELVDRCLKKRKDERIGPASELLKALEALTHDAQMPVLAEDESPFTGLSAFQESDASRFFGRDEDIATVVGKLRHQQLIAIAGPSGAGKSSFVRAGVIPALKRSIGRLETFILRPGRHPLMALAERLASLTSSPEAGSSDENDPEAIAQRLRTQPGFLGARLRTRCTKRGRHHRILLVIDQLEELFTLGIAASEQAAFCACLEGVADDPSSPLRVLVTIRSDFLDRLGSHRHFMTELMRGLTFLPLLGREALQDALKKPVEAAGYLFEDDALVDEMLDGLGGTNSPLPLLQFTAQKLWEARDRKGRRLTRKAYRALGGVAGALSTHADAVVSGLSVTEQRLVRIILVRLVTPERTRAIVRLDELVTQGDDNKAVEQVVHHLASARLLLIETGGEQEGKTVELTHESLIDRWAKLRQWLDENEHDGQFLVQLRHSAQQWEKSGEAEGLLWRDQAAREAGQWLERRQAAQGDEATSGLGKQEERYLHAVIALAERTRRWRRRLLATVIAALTATAVLVSLLAIRAREQARRADEQARRADEQARHAQVEAQQARNATRMAAAREWQRDPTTVLALLREIEGADEPRGWSELTRWALYAGVAHVVLTHEDAVFDAAFSPDGKYVITAARDKTARVWRADGTGEPLIFRGHENVVTSAMFSPDGKRLLTASHDKSARVWNADGTGEPLIFRGHEDGIVSAAFSPDGKLIVTASNDKTVRVWNVDGTGEPLILRGHENAVRSVRFSPDGKRILTASRDKTARIWNADGTGEPFILRGHDDLVGSAAFSPDGKRIVTASYDKTARVWNADGEGEPLILRGHQAGLRSVAFSPDGEHIVTGAEDKTVRVWRADGKGDPLIVRGHEDHIQSVAFSPDGRHIVTASYDKTVRIWGADGRGEPLVFRGHENTVSAARFSHDGKRIVSASTDKTARIWSADGKGEPVVLRGHEDYVGSAAFSPDGERVVTVSRDKTARVWSADGKGEPVVLRGHDDAVWWVAFSPDGKRIVTASDDKTARIWSADGKGEPVVLRGHDDYVGSAAFSPDGERVVTGSRDKTARVWSADGKGEPLILRGHEQAVWAVAFSPDGGHIVTASSDKTARVWSADGKGAPLVLRGHEHWVLSAAFSPDGQRIVTASQDKTVRVWPADGMGEPLVLRGAEGAYNHAAFSPDGLRIVAASDDKSVSVWSDLEALHGALDPRLWRVTSYCIPIDRRLKLLGVSEATAKAQQENCLRGVEDIRAAARAKP